MKIFKTKRGIVVNYQDQYFLSAESNWDQFVNRSGLHQHVLDEIGNLKPDSSLANVVTENLAAPLGNQEIWASGVTYMRIAGSWNEREDKARAAIASAMAPAKP